MNSIKTRYNTVTANRAILNMWQKLKDRRQARPSQPEPSAKTAGGSLIGHTPEGNQIRLPDGRRLGTLAITGGEDTRKTDLLACLFGGDVLRSAATGRHTPILLATEPGTAQRAWDIATKAGVECSLVSLGSCDWNPLRFITQDQTDRDVYALVHGLTAAHPVEGLANDTSRHALFVLLKAATYAREYSRQAVQQAYGNPNLMQTAFEIGSNQQKAENLIDDFRAARVMEHTRERLADLLGLTGDVESIALERVVNFLIRFANNPAFDLDRDGKQAFTWEELLKSGRPVIVDLTSGKPHNSFRDDTIMPYLLSICLHTFEDAVRKYCWHWAETSRTATLFCDNIAQLRGSSDEAVRALDRIASTSGLQMVMDFGRDSLSPCLEYVSSHARIKFHFRIFNTETAMRDAGLIPGDRYDADTLMRLPPEIAVMVVRGSGGTKVEIVEIPHEDSWDPLTAWRP